MSLNKAESKHMNKPRLFCMVDMSLCPQVLDRLREVADVEYYASPDRALLLERIDDVDVYYGHTDVRLDREVIDRAKRLKLVGAPSTGTDHIDIELLKQRGIKLISNTREYELLERFTSTAECGWALLLACTRRIPYHFAGVQNGRWMESRYTGRQLAEKTLGVVGVGRLGKMTVEFGKAFRMRVLGCDPVDFSIDNVERVDFDTLLRESDVICLHLHLRENTRNLIDSEAFAKMKEGVVIINTSRGGLIDEQAFLAALQSGKVAAAGADVLCDADWMDDVTKHPLVNFAQTHDNLILSPHIGGITVEAIAESRIFMTEKLVDYIKSNF
jgi:D-3-phosphoglycerate dehydrogenase